MIALLFEAEEATRAKERMLATLKQGTTVPAVATLPPRETGKARDLAATRAGCSPPMLGTQRRCEARIGMLLGEPKEGRPWPEITAGTTAVNPADQIERHDRSDFRLLARALDDCPLDPDGRLARRCPRWTTNC